MQLWQLLCEIADRFVKKPNIFHTFVNVTCLSKFIVYLFYFIHSAIKVRTMNNITYSVEPHVKYKLNKREKHPYMRSYIQEHDRWPRRPAGLVPLQRRTDFVCWVSWVKPRMNLVLLSCSRWRKRCAFLPKGPPLMLITFGWMIMKNLSWAWGREAFLSLQVFFVKL